jgi:hypothetical protein
MIWGLVTFFAWSGLELILRDIQCSHGFWLVTFPLPTVKKPLGSCFMKEEMTESIVIPTLSSDH